MLEQLWSSVIGFSAQFVVPDWESLVLLIPIGMAALVFLYITWTAYRLATAAPTRRGIRRVEPLPPAGLHMPGPTFAPFLAAFGAFCLMFGLIVGGLWLLFGLAVLVVTLLYWGREALRDYDRVAGGDTATHAPLTALPGPEPRVPPEGVHLPPPTFRPVLIAISMTILVAGLVVGGWALIFGLIAIAITGIGWLRDARHEYVAVESADRTGHLDLGGAPSWPMPTFAALALIVAATLLLTSGVLPNTGGAPAGSGAPGSSAAAGGGAPASAASQPAADVTITAQGTAFTQTAVDVPKGRPFTLAFDNRDTLPHNIAISDASGKVVFAGAIFTGPKVRVYDVPALPAGTYPFVCQVHTSMTGTITAK